MNILLVRHGETPWNREGRYQGRTDIPLSSDGEAQVARLGQRLAHLEITSAVASPLSRARTTAEAILAARPRAPSLELDEGLLEISHGDWEGQLAEDIAKTDPAMFERWRTSPARDTKAGPGAESLGDVLDRAWPVLERLAAKLGPTDTGLIAAHDAVNRALLCRILGLPFERVWSFRQSPATLNVLTGPSLDDLAVVRLNDSEHVAPLLREAQHKAL